MTQYEIISRVRAYICENFLYMRQGVGFGDNDSLLGRGIIDSMGIIELVEFIQDEFSIVVEHGETTDDNFGTLEGIARFVDAKRAAHAAA